MFLCKEKKILTDIQFIVFFSMAAVKDLIKSLLKFKNAKSKVDSNLMLE